MLLRAAVGGRPALFVQRLLCVIDDLEHLGIDADASDDFEIGGADLVRLVLARRVMSRLVVIVCHGETPSPYTQGMWYGAVQRTEAHSSRFRINIAVRATASLTFEFESWAWKPTGASRATTPMILPSRVVRGTAITVPYLPVILM